MGREAELAALAQALAAPPATVLIEGEAGIGKSRLLQEFLGSPAGREHRALVAYCPPFGRPLTLSPVVDALRQAAGDVRRLGLSALAGALRPLFPEWADGLPPAPEPLEDAAAARHRLFRAVAELLDRLGVRILVVEDVHWADEPTLEFLLMLTARPQGRVSVLATCRPEDLPAQSLVRRLPAQEHLTLAPLGLADSTHLMSSMLGGQQISETFAAFVHERTDGVPLMMEESLRLLHDRQDLIYHNRKWNRHGLAELQVPATVRDSVLERVSRLSPDAQLMLRAAAALAEPADIPTLSAVAGRLTRPRAIRGAEQALDSRLLAEDSHDQLSFRHDLAARAVYEAMRGSQRRSLHAAAARVLASMSPAPVARLAYHSREAGNAQNWARYGALAADAALAAGDDATGVAMLTELVKIPGLPVARRFGLAKKLAQALMVGRAIAADHGHQVVTALSGLLDSGELTARQEAEIRSPLGWLLVSLGNFARARAELERAVDHLGHDPAEATRAMVRLSWPYLLDGSAAHVDTHLEWLRKAAAMQSASLPLIDRVAITADRLTALLALGDEAGWDLLAEIPRDASSAKDRLQAGRGLANAANAAFQWGRYADAERLAAEARSLMDPRRVGQVQTCLLALELQLDWHAGRWAGLAERAVGMGSQGASLPQLEAVLVTAFLEIVGGQAGPGEERLRGLLAASQTEHVPELFAASAAALGRLRLAEGNVRAALGVTTEPVRKLMSIGLWTNVAEILPVRVEALLASGDAAAAGRLLQAWIGDWRHRDAPVAQAALLVSRALIEQAQGNGPARAAEMFAEAAAVMEAMPRVYDAALIHERQAGCLIAGGEAGKGLDALDAVRQQLVSLGALDDADRVVDTLRRHGVVVKRPQRGGRRGYGDQLSPRELEIVRLVAQGRTSREIGEILVLSTRTVESHLDAARRKLKAPSRTALVLRASEAGLVADGGEDPRPGLNVSTGK